MRLNGGGPNGMPAVPLSESVSALGEPGFDGVDLSAVAKNVGVANRIFAEVGWE
jgi:hypothetical protein